MVLQRFHFVMVLMAIGLGTISCPMQTIASEKQIPNLTYLQEVPSGPIAGTEIDGSAFQFLTFTPSWETVIVGGHWYGAHGNHSSIYPAASIWAHLPQIKAESPNMVVALGDVVRDGQQPNAFDGFQELSRQLECAVKLVNGNHDGDYEDTDHVPYGDIIDVKSDAKNLYLFLNTEWISKGGCKFSADLIREQKALDKQNVIVFSHHLLWALAEPDFAEMDDFANASYAPQIAADSVKYLYDAILDVVGEGQMHWYSGDVGTEWSFPIFADSSKDGKRHFYAAGVSDSPEDAFLKLVIHSDGNIETSIFPLGTKEWGPLSEYNLEFWRKEVPKRRAAQELTFMQKISNTLYSKKFWAGVLLGALAMGLFGLMRFWWKKRKLA